MHLTACPYVEKRRCACQNRQINLKERQAKALSGFLLNRDEWSLWETSLNCH